MIYAQLLRGEAEKNRIKALEQSRIATEQKVLADKSAKEAMEQKTLAVEQKEIANSQSQIAQQQKAIALKNSQEAMRQKEIADKNSQEAIKQKEIADKNATEAIQQKTAAERATEEAYKRRMLSIAQSMSIKTSQMEDKDLKALLAYQAYTFNTRYKGSVINPDIYAGLHNAYSALKGAGYNVFRGHSDAVKSIVFSNDTNIFYTAGSDGRILKWNLTDSAKNYTLLFQQTFVNKCLDISKDGKFLACGTIGGGIMVFDLVNKTPPVIFTELGTQVYSLAYNDSGDIIAGIDNNLIKWNPSTGYKGILGTTDGNILSISVSPDFKLVACGTQSGKILLFSATNFNKPEILLDEPKNQIHAVCFNHAGDKLASGGIQGYLKIWDIKEKKVLVNIRNHSARIINISFSHDDKLIATTSYDQSALLWDVSNLNAQPVKLRDHESWVLAAAFNKSGSRLITGGNREPRLIYWYTNASELAAILYPRISRNFTKEEWTTYVGNDIPYEITKP
jgi:hypothetical protein